MRKDGLYIYVSRAHFCVVFFEMFTMLTVVLTGIDVHDEKGKFYLVCQLQ